MNKLNSQLLPSLKTLISIAAFTAILVTILYALNFCKQPQTFPIQTVKIYGADHINHEEIRHMLLPHVAHGFFAVDVDSIKDRLTQLPWVSDTVVTRIWPNQLKITIAEKKPIARWNESSLLSQAGDLFQPDTESFPSDIPQLVGPLGEHVHMMEYLQNANQILAPLHIKVSSLKLTEDRLWNVGLDNGIKIIVAYKELLTRLSHFVKVYPRIIGTHALQVDYVDMRYANGIAVRWKQLAKQ